MIVLGLTGSIGMGKTVAAGMLRRLGAVVHDADATVHRLLGPGGDAVALVEAAFPGVAAGGAVDRDRLAKAVFGKPQALARLERILHPLVRRDERRFLGWARRQGRPLAVLDIPLLFETGGEVRVDAVVVVSAPAFLQRQRVLARPAMSAERLDAILARQTPDRVKQRRADFVVPTGLGRAFSFRRLRAIMARTRGLKAHHWPPSPYLVKKTERWEQD